MLVNMAMGLTEEHDSPTVFCGILLKDFDKVYMGCRFNIKIHCLLQLFSYSIYIMCYM